MAERHYYSATPIANVVSLRFGPEPNLSVTVPFEDIQRLLVDLANIYREAHQFPPDEPRRIEQALLEGLNTETRVVRVVYNIDVDPLPPGATQPTVLRISAGTETGPMALRISQIAAQELTAALNKHPLTRGSA